MGSSLTYQQQAFNWVMEAIELGQLQWQITAHKDWLVGFGFEWFAAFCERHGTDVVIVIGDTPFPEP